ncbi:MAG: Mut7-C RNAse domain-containing protein [Candidatus Aminicenantales bacterium]
MKNFYTAEIRLYEELNRFLPPNKRKKTQTFSWNGNRRLKDVLHFFCIPEEEVDLAIASGKSVSFNYRLKDGDRIALYPVFESLDVSSVVRLRKKPLRKTAFILEKNLDKLADCLEELGIEVIRLSRSEKNEIELISILCRKKNRVLLTQNRKFFQSNKLTHVYLIRSVKPKWQLKEVLRRFQLENILNSRKCHQQFHSR